MPPARGGLTGELDAIDGVSLEWVEDEVDKLLTRGLCWRLDLSVPLRSNGSSVGEGGGGGSRRSTSGGSVLIWITSFFLLFGAVDLRLLDFETLDGDCATGGGV